jgi:hypothetical protein
MAFTLVIVQRPRDEQGRMNQWVGFPEYAGVQSIKEAAGVYRVGQNAWIFNMKDALPEYASVISLAKDLGLQLHIFQLEDRSLASNVYSWPRSVELERFLAVS